MFNHIKSHGSHLERFTSQTLCFGMICKKDPKLRIYSKSEFQICGLNF
jgi:hypothetical protein